MRACVCVCVVRNHSKSQSFLFSRNRRRPRWPHWLLEIHRKQARICPSPFHLSLPLESWPCFGKQRSLFLYRGIAVYREDKFTLCLGITSVCVSWVVPCYLNVSLCTPNNLFPWSLVRLLNIVSVCVFNYEHSSGTI